MMPVNSIPTLPYGWKACDVCKHVGIRDTFYGKNKSFCSPTCARDRVIKGIAGNCNSLISNQKSDLCLQQNDSISNNKSPSQPLLQLLQCDEKVTPNSRISFVINKPNVTSKQNTSHTSSVSTSLKKSDKITHLPTSIRPTKIHLTSNGFKIFSIRKENSDGLTSSIASSSTVSPSTSLPSISNQHQQQNGQSMKHQTPPKTPPIKLTLRSKKPPINDPAVSPYLPFRILQKNCVFDQALPLNSLFESLSFAPVKAFVFSPLNELWSEMFEKGVIVDVFNPKFNAYWRAELVTSYGYFLKIRYLTDKDILTNNRIVSSYSIVNFRTTPILPIAGDNEEDCFIYNRSYSPFFTNLNISLKNIFDLDDNTATISSNLFDSFVKHFDNSYDTDCYYESISELEPDYMMLCKIKFKFGDWLYVSLEGGDDKIRDYRWVHPHSGFFRPMGWSQLICYPIFAPSSYIKISLYKLTRSEILLTKYVNNPALFPHEPNLKNNFSVGSTLEFLDPIQHVMKIATVTKILKLGFMIIEYDNPKMSINRTFTKSKSIYQHITSRNIFPIGFCEENNIPLYVVQDVKFDPITMPNLKKSLKEKAAPSSCFFPYGNHNQIFKEGMLLETFNMIGNGIIAYATVHRIAHRLLCLKFVNQDPLYELWAEHESPHLRPFGYSYMFNVDSSFPDIVYLENIKLSNVLARALRFKIDLERINNEKKSQNSQKEIVGSQNYYEFCPEYFSNWMKNVEVGPSARVQIVAPRFYSESEKELFISRSNKRNRQAIDTSVNSRAIPLPNHNSDSQVDQQSNSYANPQPSSEVSQQSNSDTNPQPNSEADRLSDSGNDIQTIPIPESEEESENEQLEDSNTIVGNNCERSPKRFKISNDQPSSDCLPDTIENDESNLERETTVIEEKSDEDIGQLDFETLIDWTKVNESNQMLMEKKRRSIETYQIVNNLGQLTKPNMFKPPKDPFVWTTDDLVKFIQINHDPIEIDVFANNIKINGITGIDFLRMDQNDFCRLCPKVSSAKRIELLKFRLISHLKINFDKIFAEKKTKSKRKKD